MTYLRAALLAMCTLCPGLAWAETYLLMAEQQGCYWCERWDEEIAGIYPKTEEGRQAPLRRYNMHDAPPDGIELQRRVNFTPTFLLIVDGRETGRIEGYPGEDFFWGLLALLLKEAGTAPEATGDSDAT